MIFLLCVFSTCVLHCILTLKLHECACVCVSPSPVSQPVVKRSAGESVCVSQTSPSLSKPAFTFVICERKIILTFSWPSKELDNDEITCIIALYANWGVVTAHKCFHQTFSLHLTGAHSETKDMSIVLSECKIKHNRAFLHTSTVYFHLAWPIFFFLKHMHAKHQANETNKYMYKLGFQASWDKGNKRLGSNITGLEHSIGKQVNWCKSVQTFFWNPCCIYTVDFKPSKKHVHDWWILQWEGLSAVIWGSSHRYGRFCRVYVQIAWSSFKQWLNIMGNVLI